MPVKASALTILTGSVDGLALQSCMLSLHNATNLAALEAVDDFWAGGDAPPELTAQIRAAIAKAKGE